MPADSQVRRPHDYNAAAARLLGPSEPNPRINIAALGVVSAFALDK
jgi:splicing factor U2AF subunit